MRPALLVAALLTVSLLAGCTGGNPLQKASVDNPSFSLEPASGGKDTVFRVDAGRLGDKHNVTWDWGDGTLSYGRVAEHRYGFTNGEMTVTMLVTDESGKQGLASRVVTLGTGENADPRVGVTAARKWVEVGKTVNLTARGSDSDRDPLAYLWTYRVLSGGVAPAGDGHDHDHGTGSAPSTQGEFLVDGTGPRVGVAFDAPGKYAVQVRAKDPKGGEAVAQVEIDVSSRIPDSKMEVAFSGTLAAGTGGEASASEALWLTPAPDTFVDAARHAYSLRYPATTLILLSWNDTSGQGATDLDLELRNAKTNETIFQSRTRAPAAPMELNFTDQEPGDYLVIVRNVAGAQVAYELLVHATLKLTPELVAAVEGS